MQGFYSKINTSENAPENGDIMKASSAIHEDMPQISNLSVENLKERRATLMNRLTNKSVDNDLNFFKNSAFVKSRKAVKCAQRIMHILVIIVLSLIAVT